MKKRQFRKILKKVSDRDVARFMNLYSKSKKGKLATDEFIDRFNSIGCNSFAFMGNKIEN